MPATTEKEIWSLLHVVESAVGACLNEAGLPNVLLPRSGESLPSSRVEVSFLPGEASNRHTLPSGRKVYDFFSGGELRIRLATERPHSQASLIPGVGDLHSEFVATVLDALDEGKTPHPLNPRMPYHYVTQLRLRGVLRDLDTRFLEDFTELRFLVDLGIHTNAWPA